MTTSTWQLRCVTEGPAWRYCTAGARGSGNAPSTAPSTRRPDLAEFREQQLDIYIPAGDTGYWQGALRDPEEPGYAEVVQALQHDGIIQVDMLYGDHEGGQRAIARFVIAPWPDKPGERAWVVRYWTSDLDDPRHHSSDER
jgi:hypothetical protein